MVQPSAPMSNLFTRHEFDQLLFNRGPDGLWGVFDKMQRHAAGLNEEKSEDSSPKLAAPPPPPVGGDDLAPEADE